MKYKVILEYEFESDTEMAEVSVSANGEDVESLIDHLPEPPDDVDANTVKGKIELYKIL